MSSDFVLGEDVFYGPVMDTVMMYLFLTRGWISKVTKCKPDVWYVVAYCVGKILAPYVTQLLEY